MGERVVSTGLNSPARAGGRVRGAAGRRVRAAAVLSRCVLGVVIGGSTGIAWGQAAPATAPTTPAATTVPATRAVAASTRAGNNGVRGVTTQPGGVMMLNFKEASIDSVLDDLSAAAGVIVVKGVKPEGRGALVSRQGGGAGGGVGSVEKG